MNNLLDFVNRLPLSKQQRIDFIIAVLDKEKKNEEETKKNKIFFSSSVLKELLYCLHLKQEETPAPSPLSRSPSPSYYLMNEDDFKEGGELSMLTLRRC